MRFYRVLSLYRPIDRTRGAGLNEFHLHTREKVLVKVSCLLLLTCLGNLQSRICCLLLGYSDGPGHHSTSLSTRSVGAAHLSDRSVSICALTARTDIGDKIIGLGGLFTGLGDDGKP